MPNTSKENARLFAERLRIEAEKIHVEQPGKTGDKQLTISCGIATYPEDANSKDELILKADLALYEAKRSGKNRICLYSKAMGEKK